MIHQYQNNGYNIVLDVNSGAVHVVDKAAYDVIACLEAMNPSHTHMTATWPVSTVLRKRGNITGDVR